MNFGATARQRAGAAGGILQAGSPFLGLLPPELAKRPKDAYFATSEFLPLPAGGALSDTIAITSATAFLILGATRVVTAVDNVTVVNFLPALVTITDGSDRSLMDEAVHAENIFGTAQLPAIWAFPKFIAAGSTIKTALQNLDPANARNIRVTYFGFKIY